MRVVLFDLDDTLFDKQYCSRAGLLAVQKVYAGRIVGSVEEIESTYGELLEEWHQKVLAGLISINESRVERFRVLLSNSQTEATDAESQAAARCYRDAYDAAYRPVPGAIELLRRVKAERPVGIVTNHITSQQVKKIAAIGVEPLIDELVVSEEVGVPKPAAKIFEVALSRSGPDTFAYLAGRNRTGVSGVGCWSCRRGLWDRRVPKRSRGSRFGRTTQTRSPRRRLQQVGH